MHVTAPLRCAEFEFHSQIPEFAGTLARMRQQQEFAVVACCDAQTQTENCKKKKGPEAGPFHQCSPLTR